MKKKKNTKSGSIRILALRVQFRFFFFSYMLSSPLAIALTKFIDNTVLIKPLGTTIEVYILTPNKVCETCNQAYIMHIYYFIKNNILMMKVFSIFDKEHVLMGGKKSYNWIARPKFKPNIKYFSKVLPRLHSFIERYG